MTVDFDLAAPPTPPRDAATVIVLRDAPAGPEIFFVRRPAGQAFMGGAYVFPGGKLDPADLDPAIPCDLDPGDAARRLEDPDPARARALHVTALRECLEESGILLATEPVPATTIAALRDALAPRDAPPLRGLLERHGIVLRASALVPLARWITPVQETRRFDARFFLARAPVDTVASHDRRETVDSAWLSAREALARSLRREIVLPPPTFRTLELLALASSTDDALALAPAVIPTLQPRVVLDGSHLVVALPGDPRHGDPCPPMVPHHAPAPPTTLATRFRYDDGQWIPEHG